MNEKRYQELKRGPVSYRPHYVQGRINGRWVRLSSDFATKAGARAWSCSVKTVVCRVRKVPEKR